MTAPTFTAWPKTPRLFRDIIVTEKIDGTNGAIGVVKRDDPAYIGRTIEQIELTGASVTHDDHVVWCQSRNRILHLGVDNAGFRDWVTRHADQLAHNLGVGLHFGEWWGAGIQRGYGLASKRFSLFNTTKWADADFNVIGLHVVPVLYEGPFDTAAVQATMHELSSYGSQAAPGFMRPEGVCIYHTAARRTFKALLESDHIAKSDMLAADIPMITSAWYQSAESTLRLTA